MGVIVRRPCPTTCNRLTSLVIQRYHYYLSRCKRRELPKGSRMVILKRLFRLFSVAIYTRQTKTTCRGNRTQAGPKKQPEISSNWTSFTFHILVIHAEIATLFSHKHPTLDRLLGAITMLFTPELLANLLLKDSLYCASIYTRPSVACGILHHLFPVDLAKNRFADSFQLVCC